MPFVGHDDRSYRSHVRTAGGAGNERGADGAGNTSGAGGAGNTSGADSAGNTSSAGGAAQATTSGSSATTRLRPCDFARYARRSASSSISRSVRPGR